MMKTFLLLLFCATALTANASYHHKKKFRQPKLSHTEQLAQNQVIERLQLLRIKDDKQLNILIRSKWLVPIKETAALFVDPDLPVARRYCLASTLAFLEEISARYYERFGKPLVLTSAVRTVRTQTRLLHFNHNAAPAHGEAASSHLTGATVDISWRRMTKEQREFTERMLRVYALYNQVIYLKEWAQPCYHVMVIPYENWYDLQNNQRLSPSNRRTIAQPVPTPHCGGSHGWPRIN